MISRRRFVIFGFFGGWNSGDEAILESVHRMLIAKHPDAEVAAICSRLAPGEVERYQSRGIEVAAAGSFRDVSRLLKSHQLIVGGGQIITGDRRYKGLLFLWSLIWRAQRSGQAKPIMVGIGVEGVHRWLAKWLCRRIVACARAVGCRDSYSMDMLVSAGCPKSKLRVTADVVFSGVVQAEQQPDANALTDGLPPIAIGLHHSPVRQLVGFEFYLNLVQKLRIGFPGRDLVIVSNDIRERFDAGLLNQLQHEIKDPKVRFQSLTNVGDVISIYASSACVISVRMHPLILSLIHGRPVIGVGKSNKVQELAKRVGFQLYIPEQTTDTELQAMVEKAVDQSSTDIDLLRELSWTNFDYL